MPLRIKLEKDDRVIMDISLATLVMHSIVFKGYPKCVPELPLKMTVEDTADLGTLKSTEIIEDIDDEEWEK